MSIQLCENCQKGIHHNGQDVENCDCNCPNTVRGNHVEGDPADLSDRGPSNIH